MSGDEREQMALFLTAVLGDGGELPTGLYGHIWHLADKHTDWVRTAGQAEASAMRNGRHDVYMGSGLTAAPGGAYERVREETAVGMLGVAGDIDVAHHVHKQTALPADNAAALAWLDAAGLPATAVVDSGHGIQPHWVFTEPWRFGATEKARGVRLRRAWQARLGALARARGWKLDNVSDLSRVMRVPGTINAKDPANMVPVRLLHVNPAARYTPDDLEALCTEDDYRAAAEGAYAAREAAHAAREAGSVSPEQRFTRDNPCPVCKGHKDMAQGTGDRDWGFFSEDGSAAFCTREECAGALEPHTTAIGTVYVHRLYGRCRCGVPHNSMPQPLGVPYAETDSGNGQRLLDAHGADLLYIKGRTHPWHAFDGACWLSDRTQQVERWMQEQLRAALVAVAGNSYTPRHQLQGQTRWLTQSLDMAKIRAGAVAASLHRTVTYDVFDRDPWLLPCANGLTYDLRDGTLRPTAREDRMSHCAPIAASYKPLPHPKWDAVLRLVMDNDEDMVRYLRQCLGLLLTGDTSEKCFWFWVGRTNAGKTTLLVFLERLLGAFGGKIALRALLKRQEDLAIRHDLAELQGRRFVYAEEFKPGDVLNAGVVKEVSGDGTITADRKGEANETFRVGAKLILGTNDMPNLTDIDDAIRGRVRVVKFPVNIPEVMAARGERLRSVAEVVDDLLTEAPGILQDLVAAVGEWRAAGSKLVMPAKVYEATKDYLNDQDPLVPWKETCCVQPADGAPVETEELPFATWYWSFIEQSERDPKYFSKHWFGRQLERHKFVKRVAYNGKFYTGPKLTDLAKNAAVYRAATSEEWHYSSQRGHGKFYDESTGGPRDWKAHPWDDATDAR